MQVTRLALRDFRNFAAAEVRPHPRFNVLYGDNGQGKTNLLEALYWLATLRPLRANRLQQLIRWGHKSTRVDGEIRHDGLDHQLAVEVRDGERVALREGKQSRAAHYFGALAVVLFTPDDTGLVRGSPADRRRFLDRAIFTGRPAHLADVVGYRRALDSRNALLRDRADDTLVEVYEATLADHAARLMRARRAYIERLAPRFADVVHAIIGDELAIECGYRPSLGAEQLDTGHGPDDATLAAALAAHWADDRARDRDRGFTQRGPHADDLTLSLLDRAARNYASQGQQRAMVLALKIAEIQLLEDQHRTTPVLLLDDVSSELDPRRNARLFDFLGAFEGQVFITTTDPAFLKIDADRHTWRVTAGTVTAEEE